LVLHYTLTAYADEYTGLFGTTEYKSNDLKSFKKWNDLRERHNKSRLIKIRETSNNIHHNQWQALLNKVKDASPIIKMDEINRFMNNKSYITDFENWNVSDYWATIDQFFSKAGDCEDYAIAKYYSLKKLGFSDDQMRVVVVEDTNLRVAHAVLAVYIENKIWILDNQISQLVTDDSVFHYQPLYSINEHAWWLHKN
jgi:predicted transglutaminase-like cysteine proteinase